MATAILAVQGAFAEHARMLRDLGEDTFELRQASDLARPFERLVLPGGESTVQAKLISEQGMLEPLRERVADGTPVLATCAGLVLLASDIQGNDPPRGRRLATFPMTAARNAYGRQLGSFQTIVAFEDIGDVPATFIRAPRIILLGEEATALAAHDGHVVAARYGNQIACAFHPELADDPRVHELFLSL